VPKNEAAAALKAGGVTLIALEIGNELELYGKTWRPANYSNQDFKRVKPTKLSTSAQ
jgi:hypothetical protein